MSHLFRQIRQSADTLGWEHHRTRELVDRACRENEKLVHHVTKGYKGRPYYDDAVQYARYGLVYAIRRHDPESGHQFSTFAVKTMWGWAVRALPEHHGVPRGQWNGMDDERRGRVVHPVRLDAGELHEETVPLTLVADRGDQRQREVAETGELLAEVLQVLPADDRLMLAEHYWNERPLSHLAKEDPRFKRLCRQTLHARHTRAMRKLRQACEERGLTPDLLLPRPLPECREVTP